MKNLNILFLCLVGLLSTTPTAVATDLKLRVSVGDVGPDGTPYDGTRIYLLPFDVTTANPPDLAVCVHTNSGEIVCQPSDLVKGLSPCPDKKSCTFSLTLKKPFEYLVVSVFDIDPVTRKVADRVTSLFGRMGSYQERLSLPSSISDAMHSIANAKLGHWEWIESAAFTKDPDADLFSVNNSEIDDLVRQHAKILTPISFRNFTKGRISAPFDLKPIWDCLYPAPECYYEYVQIIMKSDALDAEVEQ